MKFGRLGSRVGYGDSDQDVLRAVLGVFHEDVEIPVFVKDAGIEQFILHVVLGTTKVSVYEIGIRIGRLRVFIEVLHVRVRWRAVEVEVVFLDILSVIALTVGQPEKPFLENRILAVPQGQREAELLFVIGDASQTVFAPAVGARTRLVVGEKIPGIAAFAIILADGAPLPLTEIWSPLLPRKFSLPCFIQPPLFRRKHDWSPLPASALSSC